MMLMLSGAFACLLAGTALAADSGADDAGAVSSAIDEAMAAYAADGSGAALIVELPDRRVLTFGYGYANREQSVPFTVDTIAQVGSLTKQFTAAAVLALASDGALALDQPIGRYLEGLPAQARPLTAHQLLTHSAGLPEYCGDDFERVGRGEMLERCLALPLRFEPGSDTGYSNAGYSVLAALVEAVSGRRYEDYLREEILRPNGLPHADFVFPATAGERLAHGYLDGEDAGVISERIRVLDDEWWNLKGNGGLQATAQEMYRWFLVLNGRAGRLQPEIRSAMTEPQAPWQDDLAEGYGWFFRKNDAGDIVQMSHAGSDGVFFAYYWHRPQERVFLYFVSNGGEDAGVAALRKVRAAIGGQ